MNIAAWEWERPKPEDLPVREGQEYVVLETYMDPGRQITFRLEVDEIPSLWPAALFITTEGTIPSNWVARLDRDGTLAFAPRSWFEPDFWDLYFDREPAALAIFESEKERIYRESEGT